MARRDAPGSGRGLGNARASDSEAADDAPAADAPADKASAADALAADALAAGAKPDGAPALAPAPGPLPFDVTVREQVRRDRGSVASALVAFFAVLFFFAAAAGGFALARHVGGEPIMPPTRQTTPTQTTPPVDDDSGALAPRTGNAASTTPAQGGGFQVPVPGDWVEFTEEVAGDELPLSTRFYYVSPDGTQLLTVERFVDFYPGHGIEEYEHLLGARGPEVVLEGYEAVPVNGIAPGGTAQPETAKELVYGTITSAQELAPGDPNARDVYQRTFARLLPYARDLWVVSLTVLIDQESSGRELFADIANGFRVTG